MLLMSRASHHSIHDIDMAVRKSIDITIVVIVIELLVSAYHVRATNNIDTTVFTVVKEYCDVGTSPARQILKVSAMRCASECQREGDLSACRGFNYRSGADGNSCELHRGDSWPTFEVVQGCKYHTVCVQTNIVIRPYINMRSLCVL